MHHRTLSDSKKKYLATMTELDPSGKGIRSITIAKELNVTRPSVHAMLNRLSDDGFLVKEHYGIVFLTARGLEVGKKILETNHNA